MQRTMTAKIFAHHYTGNFAIGVVFENSITVNVTMFENGTYSHTVTARRKFVDGSGKFVAIEFDMPNINVKNLESALGSIQETSSFLETEKDISPENLPRYMSSYGIMLANNMSSNTYSVPYDDDATRLLFGIVDLKKLIAMTNQEVLNNVVMSA
jgi:hypothetical protein